MNVGGYVGGCRITAITSAFQADDVGSTPISRLKLPFLIGKSKNIGRLPLVSRFN